jgi:hypothetical protein
LIRVVGPNPEQRKYTHERKHPIEIKVTMAFARLGSGNY